MTFVQNYVSIINSLTKNMSAPETFTGTAESVYLYNAVCLRIQTDAPGIVFMQFSPDGINFSTAYTTNINPSQMASDGSFSKILPVSAKFYRTVYVNGASATANVRIQTMYGSYEGELLVDTRDVSSPNAIMQGQIPGSMYYYVKGTNPDMFASSVTPADLWGGGSQVYEGFMLTSDSNMFAISSDNTDTGSLKITYLLTADSTEFTTTDYIQINGTTETSLGFSAQRIIDVVYYNQPDPSLPNAGTISIYSSEPFIMKIIPPGLGKQQDCNFTVPDTYTGYIQRVYASVDANVGGKVSGYLWISGMVGSSPEIGSPQMLNPFTSSTTMGSYEESFVGGIRIPPKTDITLRATSSTDDAYCTGGFDILLIKNANGV